MVEVKYMGEYDYIPSIPAAVIFIGLFGILTLLHCWQVLCSVVGLGSSFLLYSEEYVSTSSMNPFLGPFPVLSNKVFLQLRLLDI